MLKHATVHAGLGIAMHHDSSGSAAGTIISLSLGNMCHTSIGHGVFVLQQASNPPLKKKNWGEKWVMPLYKHGYLGYLMNNEFCVG